VKGFIGCQKDLDEINVRFSSSKESSGLFLFEGLTGRFNDTYPLECLSSSPIGRINKKGHGVCWMLPYSKNENKVGFADR
jgi:hypothetical protein